MWYTIPFIWIVVIILSTKYKEFVRKVCVKVLKQTEEIVMGGGVLQPREEYFEKLCWKNISNND